jgi:hypothetical protein
VESARPHLRACRRAGAGHSGSSPVGLNRSPSLPFYHRADSRSSACRPCPPFSWSGRSSRRGLRRLRGRAGRGAHVVRRARAGLLRPARPQAPGAGAARRRRPVALGRLVDPDPYAALDGAFLPRERPAWPPPLFWPPQGQGVSLGAQRRGPARSAARVVPPGTVAVWPCYSEKMS